jgi:antitoxin (DNA-binding transcriptional repressor) of toxin-antitoxin stability system
MNRYIKGSAFKAKCLALIDEAERTGDLLTILKNGQPIAELRPRGRRRGKRLGILSNELFITGDIVSPIDVEWDVLK